jgi:Kef-type K+ transport system membrane component KefB
MALGSVKVKGIGLGTAGVLFAGILVGHSGKAVHHTLDFVKEFGLILFVFTIGLQLGLHHLPSRQLARWSRAGLRCRKAIGFPVFFPVIFRTAKRRIFRFPV